jgi:hypothetical protein
MHAFVLAAAGLLALMSPPVASPDGQDGVRAPSARVLAFARTCEMQRGIATTRFVRHLQTRGRGHAGWTIVLEGPDDASRLAHAKQIAAAAGGSLYRVDADKLVGRTIGETEKNLSRLFARARKKDWVLFFDEADALFGKRSEIDDAHDRYDDLPASTLSARLIEQDELVIIGTRTAPSKEVSPHALRDIVVTAQSPAKPGGKPPELPWSAVCWSPVARGEP